MRAHLRTLPNQLTALRLLLVPLLWALALRDQPRWVGVGLVLALLTDALDGPIARRRGEATAWGAVFDSLADKLLSVSVVGWLALLRPAIFTAHPRLILLAALCFAASLLVGLLKWGRPAPLHLLSAQLGGGVQALFVLHALLSDGYSRPLLYAALGLLILAALEEIAVQLAVPRPDARIRSILALRRGRFRS